MKLCIRALALAAIALSLSACSDPEVAKREHFENAQKFMAAGKPQEAIVEYRNALQEDPKYGEARYKLADAYESVGNSNQAYREYIRAADLLPQDNDLQVKAAEYLILAGQFEDARTRVQPVIQRDPANVNAQLVLGRALVGLKDLDGAVKEIEEAINLDPKRAVSYSSLAGVKLAQGNLKEAKAAFEKAVEVEPRSMRARLTLGLFQASTNELVAAEASLKSALEIDPKNVLTNRALAAFYMGSQRAPQAEPYLKTLAEGGAPAATLQLADYYVLTRRAPEARAVLQPLLKDPSSSAEAEIRLAVIAYTSNQREQAHKLIDGVIGREPANVNALLQKAQWLSFENKPQEALQQAQAAAKADPKNVPAQYFLGVVQARLQMRKEAIASFSEVLRLNPRAAAAQTNLANLSLLEGAPGEAMSFAESAIANAPNSPDARASLVRALIARRETARATQELVPLQKQYPNVAVVHSIAGTLKLQQKDYVGARTEFDKALQLNGTLTEAVAGLTAVDMAQNKMPEARQRIEKLVESNPNRADLLLVAAQVYREQRDLPKAEAVLRRAIQADSTSNRAYTMLAGVLLASGKLDAARAEFDQIGQRDSKNVGALTMAAMIVHSQNKVADAKKRYETIVNADPTAAVAGNNLAWIYAEEGEKLDEALRLAQGAASRLPESAEVQDTIGWVYYKQELPALAITAFQRSVDREPNNPTYHYHLALAFSKAGDADRARQSAQQALKLQPDYADAQKLLSQIKG